jgi:carboxyl-terminal processing protease
VSRLLLSRLRLLLRRRRLPATAAFLAAAAGAGVAAQSWRSAAVASFDTTWQTINDTYYDPSFGGLDWSAVSRELRPKVERAGTPAEARDVIRELLSRLGRSHFTLLTPSAAEALPGPAAVPIDVRIRGDEVVVTRAWPAEPAATQLSAGQLIAAIDGRPVAELWRDVVASDDRTRQLLRWQQINRALHGNPGETVRLRVRPVSGDEREVVAARRMPEGEFVQLGNMPPLQVRFDARDARTPAGRDAGVIDFSVWMVPVASPITLAVDRFRQRPGIVIDLRGNLGGLMSMIQGVAGHFLSEPELLGTMRTRREPLVFRANPRTVMDDGRRVEVYAGPVAILVDELTASTSDIFASALQGLGRARIFGRQTMGQALPAVTKTLPSGDVLLYAMGDFTAAGGKSVEGAGVVPDERIPLSRESLARGADDILEAALKWIDAGGRSGR